MKTKDFIFMTLDYFNLSFELIDGVIEIKPKEEMNNQETKKTVFELMTEAHVLTIYLLPSKTCKLSAAERKAMSSDLIKIQAEIIDKLSSKGFHQRGTIEKQEQELQAFRNSSTETFDQNVMLVKKIQKLEAENEKLNEYNNYAFGNALELDLMLRDRDGVLEELSVKIEGLEVSIDHLVEICEDQSETIKLLRKDLKTAKGGFEAIVYFGQQKTKKIAGLNVRVAELSKEVKRLLIDKKISDELLEDTIRSNKSINKSYNNKGIQCSKLIKLIEEKDEKIESLKKQLK